MISSIEYLNLPISIGVTIVGVFLIMQIIGGILDFHGKVVPAFMNVRKHFSRKKEAKKKASQTLERVEALLDEVNGHYSVDNIAKRDGWMNWVNERAVVYDESIKKITETLAKVEQALTNNTAMTEEMFVQDSRDRIINFATKVENKNTMVSREEFNRIFKVYDDYEKFLKEHNKTNGEVDINYQIIRESYEDHLHNHTFIEDVRGYASKK